MKEKYFTTVQQGCSGEWQARERDIGSLGEQRKLATVGMEMGRVKMWYVSGVPLLFLTE